MLEINYVCMSDTHFGEPLSLLTNTASVPFDINPFEPSAVLEQLVNCLYDLITKCNNDRKPTLILIGDILELALNTDDRAVMCFDRFLELIFPKNRNSLFDSTIYFIPGNHDHHLWEISREIQYIRYLVRHKGLTPPAEPWHVTPIFETGMRRFPFCPFLNAIAKKHGKGKNIKFLTAYPNFGLVKKDGSKCIIFHHGHFVDPFYHLMTDLKHKLFTGRKLPLEVWDIETENFAWIDFFWSTLGRSGEVGVAIDSIYKRMLHGEVFKGLLTDVTMKMAKDQGLLRLAEKEVPASLPGPISNKVATWLINKKRILQNCVLRLVEGTSKSVVKGLIEITVDHFLDRESTKTEQHLSESCERGLKEYLEIPLHSQISRDLKSPGKDRAEMPIDVAFVFGHTHKPFQRANSFGGYHNPVRLYNTGGWVVESVEPHPKRGAALVLIVKELNATSLRLYNEAGEPDEYRVKVETTETEFDNGSNEFHQQIADLINSNRDPWRSFSESIRVGIEDRSQDLDLIAK